MGQQRAVVVAAILGSTAVFVDSTVVNVALAQIRDDLGGGIAGQEWVAGAYLLTLGALLLVGGALGDLRGPRRMFIEGTALFGITSVLCAVAPTIETLIAARALQGMAGALLVPNTLGLIVAQFPPNERGAAIGSWTAWTSVALVTGPLVGGLIIDLVSWRWIFAINVVPVAAAIVVALRVAPDTPKPGGRVDYVGATLATLGLAGPVFALIEQPRRGWGDAVILGTLLGGLALLAAFVAHERRAATPMMPLELFRNRNFAVGNAATLLIYGGFGAATFFPVIFLQQVAGYSALAAGAAFLPVTGLLFVLSKRFGALSDRIGPRAFMTAGPIICGVGIGMLARIDASGDYVSQVLPAVLVYGVGLSLTVAPLTATVLGGVPEEHAGMASAINNAVARLAGLLVLAAVGAVVAAHYGSVLQERLAGVRDPGIQRVARDAAEHALTADARNPVVRAAQVDASEDAFRLAMLITAGLVIVGGVLSAVGIENPRRDPSTAPDAPPAPG